MQNIILKNKTHNIRDLAYGMDDKFLISFDVDASFRQAKSHAAEVNMLCTYSPESEYGSEGDDTYIALINDDRVYDAGEEYKEKGSVSGTSDLVPLTGRFHFRAKMEYYKDIMYFYSFDGCGGDWENTGLCVVYPREYSGTVSEKRLMKALDDAAASYREDVIQVEEDDEEPQEKISRDTVKAVSPAQKGRGIKEAVLNAARLIKLIRTLVLIAMLLGIGGYYLYGRIKDEVSVHHLVQLRGDERILSGFTQEDEQKILSAYDLHIPESESDAHIVSFIKGSRNEKITSYIIEIDGVKDEEGFYSANSHRSLEKAVNELDTRENGKKYYITYHERVTEGSKSGNNNDAIEKIVSIYDELSEKYGGQ